MKQTSIGSIRRVVVNLEAWERSNRNGTIIYAGKLSIFSNKTLSFGSKLRPQNEIGKIQQNLKNSLGECLLTNNLSEWNVFQKVARRVLTSKISINVCNTETHMIIIYGYYSAIIYYLSVDLQRAMSICLRYWR